MQNAPTILRGIFKDRCPILLQEKDKSLQDFVKMLKQYQSLNQLAISARQIVESPLAEKMAETWQNIDLESTLLQAFSICPQSLDILKVVHENILLKLSSRASIFRWAEWIFSLCENWITTVNTP